MGVKFLTAEWADAATEALSAHGRFASAIEGVDLALQFEVVNCPGDAQTSYYAKVANGSAAIRMGTARKADISVSTDYPVAVAISKGELNVQTAFFAGKLRVSGNLAKLMLNQGALGPLAAAVSTLDVEY
ncbi:MAG: SCP2 sterol-binding domain-containing protein [bacterium]|nr:SCP2 sterol-binding domain-containing protein [bacterium]MDE0289398.1 SCP2 sterol-binding domain-containing protein [bacterium]MDE0439468.1 SCP2 sterol-binding domain-containing protein [bacterium]